VCRQQWQPSTPLYVFMHTLYIAAVIVAVLERSAGKLTDAEGPLDQEAARCRTAADDPGGSGRQPVHGERGDKADGERRQARWAPE
jgi:hypothetical protein